MAKKGSKNANREKKTSKNVEKRQKKNTKNTKKRQKTSKITPRNPQKRPFLGLFWPFLALFWQKNPRKTRKKRQKTPKMAKNGQKCQKWGVPKCPKNAKNGGSQNAQKCQKWPKKGGPKMSQKGPKNVFFRQKTLFLHPPNIALNLLWNFFYKRGPKKDRKKSPQIPCIFFWSPKSSKTPGGTRYFCKKGPKKALFGPFSRIFLM